MKNYNFFLLALFAFQDPDKDSTYAKNTDPIRIRIHNGGRTS
jgi:hypothetical protein